MSRNRIHHAFAVVVFVATAIGAISATVRSCTIIAAASRSN